MNDSPDVERLLAVAACLFGYYFYYVEGNVYALYCLLAFLVCMGAWIACKQLLKPFM